MQTVLLIFGGSNPEYYVSCDSASEVIKSIDLKIFNVLQIGITLDGKWLLTDASPEEIGDGISWTKRVTNRPAFLTPVRGKNSVSVQLEPGIREIPVDCVFPLIHGYGGEDGCLQGLLELSGIPYVGSGVAASACAMDKQITRLFAQSCGMNLPACTVLKRGEKEKLEDYLYETGLLSFPVYVKPAKQGSSVGVSKAVNKEQLLEAMKLAFSFDEKILVEEGIDGFEIKVAVLGDRLPEIGEICKLTVPEGKLNDYDTKYQSFSSIKEIPAVLDKKLEDEIKKQALSIYRELECRGFARVDFFVDGKGKIYFNELNTIPGLGSSSVYVSMFEAKGLQRKELFTRLIYDGKRDQHSVSSEEKRMGSYDNG